MVVHKIPSVEGNLFTFGLICYFCPGSQKKFSPAQDKGISNELISMQKDQGWL
jgi:hypothetical protein